MIHMGTSTWDGLAGQEIGAANTNYQTQWARLQSKIGELLCEHKDRREQNAPANQIFNTYFILAPYVTYCSAIENQIRDHMTQYKTRHPCVIEATRGPGFDSL